MCSSGETPLINSSPVLRRVTAFPIITSLGLKLFAHITKRLQRSSSARIHGFRCSTSNSMTAPRVLYIEDHDDTRELVRTLLERKGYEIVTGATIKSGVALAGSQHFDLYLIDSWLLDGSGVELCRQLRDFDKVTPILFYSAAAYESDRQQALASGAQAYLVKPSHTSDLCDLVASLIKSSRTVGVSQVKAGRD